MRQRLLAVRSHKLFWLCSESSGAGGVVRDRTYTGSAVFIRVLWEPALSRPGSDCALPGGIAPATHGSEGYNRHANPGSDPISKAADRPSEVGTICSAHGAVLPPERAPELEPGITLRCFFAVQLFGLG